MDVKEYIDENGSVKIEVTDDKFKKPFIISKMAEGNAFFEVTQGSVKAKTIHGMFTSPEEALQAVRAHIRKSPKSQAKRRDDNWERRHGAKRIA